MNNPGSSRQPRRESSIARIRNSIKTNTNYNKFCLLMWKNWILQKRHPAQTLFELMVPAIFTAVLVVARSMKSPITYSQIIYTPFQITAPAVAAIETLRIIAWSPVNPIFDKIMQTTVSEFSSTTHLQMRLQPFANSKQMDAAMLDENAVEAILCGVQFDDSLANATDLSKNVTIVIRFPSETRRGRWMPPLLSSYYVWFTHRIFPQYPITGPRHHEWNEGAEPGYNFEGFLLVQKALSIGIINHFKQKLYKQPLKVPNLTMQRFPYPGWFVDVLPNVLQLLGGLIITMSFLYTCIATVKLITVEKEKQLKEAMKIMGLPNWLHWFAWFVRTFIIVLISITLMVVLLKANWYEKSDYSVLTNTDPTVLFYFLLIYGCSVITASFLITAFFSNANMAATIAGVIWFLSYLPFTIMQIRYNEITLTQKLSASVLCNAALGFGFNIIFKYEAMGEGLQWDNLNRPVTADDDLNMNHIINMLIFDTIFYFILAIYVEAVFPGEYGVPLPWYFLFSWTYWCGYKGGKDENTRKEESLESDIYEKEPKHLTVGIKIRHLRKVFVKNKVAVHDLSLNMLNNQITVLLGHNGAGKTTTMSMLTGMITPTSGTAIINGYDIRTQMKGVRHSLGFCPQHNILFDDLTVREHLYFYALLKGMRKDVIEKEIDKFVTMLELQPKANKRSCTLSGGMKRKLSIGIALCSGSSVVLLDEPTAGMDPAARRAIWDLIESQKKGRCILLSTHFMDEADLLGDRIAIMAGGKLQSCGSSFFLKKKYGAGYHLVMVKKPDCNVNDVTKLLQKTIPDVKMESSIGSDLTYLLDESRISLFQELLKSVESDAAKLGILSFGISLTTLEEVFLKVGIEHDKEITPKVEVQQLKKEQKKPGSSKPSLSDSSATKFKPVVGCRLWFNQLLAMFMKRRLSYFRSWPFLLLHIILPSFFAALAIVIVRKIVFYYPMLKMRITMDMFENPVTVMTINHDTELSTAYTDYLHQNKRLVVNWGDQDMVDKMLQKTITDTATVRERFICGASFNKDNSITAWFNNEPYHSPSLALQLVMNAILRSEISPNHKIEIFNYPFPFTSKTKMEHVMRGANTGFQITFNIAFAMVFVSASFISFYVQERSSKSKHLQFISGARVCIFWPASFVSDLLVFAIVSLTLIVTFTYFQEPGFKTADELWRCFLVLSCFSFAVLPLMYLSAYFFEIPATAYTKMALLVTFTGLGTFLLVHILRTPEFELTDLAEILHKIFLFIPIYSMSEGLKSMYIIYITHSLCDVMLDKCLDAGISLEICKENLCRKVELCCTMTKDYFDWEYPGIGRNFMCFAIVFVVATTILMLIEFKCFENIVLCLRRATKRPRVPDDPNEDSDVLEERRKIRNLSKNETKSYKVVMRDVTKYYGKFLAVHKTCLGILDNECFGLLGVNGAGKTTIFKMMTGESKMTCGKAWINGYSLRDKMKEVYQLIGYCPQFDALLQDLTCRETLFIFGLLRGVPHANCNTHAEILADEFDFFKHIDKKVKQLSGGNKRKLSTTLAAMGDPVVIYLDEPSTGMDPGSKRHLWNAICKVRDRGKAIVLTSHSMEECEALCTRLAIMVNGRFKCLGSTQHLKSKFSEGYTLTLKAQRFDGTLDQQKQKVNVLEESVLAIFPKAVLREKHEELFTYYIPYRSDAKEKAILWSDMFGTMEKAKRTMEIEDYSLAQSSLEQVFLTFTKYQETESLT